MLIALLQAIVSGLAVGSAYALIALGFSITFNVARAFDEASGIDDPVIWTAERDRQMWESASPADRNRAKREPPPSERAARIVQGNFYKEMDWKAVLNLISSQKVPRIFMND